jgi:hypothetical protein
LRVTDLRFARQYYASPPSSDDRRDISDRIRFAACAEEFKKGEPEMSILIKLAGEYGIEFQSDPVR